mmetsp:Transcript_46348/g.122365  ORF Transcript_46348/g.122365 Transcript_46348/m.122365 type:complete len:180 (+) Transcript_46348:1165-1704(+)
MEADKTPAEQAEDDKQRLRSLLALKRALQQSVGDCNKRRKAMEEGVEAGPVPIPDIVAVALKITGATVPPPELPLRAGGLPDRWLPPQYKLPFPSVEQLQLATDWSNPSVTAAARAAAAPRAVDASAARTPVATPELQSPPPGIQMASGGPGAAAVMGKKQALLKNLAGDLSSDSESAG